MFRRMPTACTTTINSQFFAHLGINLKKQQQQITKDGENQGTVCSNSDRLEVCTLYFQTESKCKRHAVTFGIADKPKSGFQPLADAVKNLPTQTKSALQATEEFNEEADLLGALPVVKKLQALTTRAQSLMEVIHSEASELFTV